MSLSKREEYQNRMDEQLALWSARLEALKTHAGKDPKPDVAEQLARWHDAEAAAAAKLAKLKGTSGEEWDLVKVEVESAWHAIDTALDEGVSGAARLITKEEIESLTPEQQDAILEAMVIAVVADGEIDDKEVARFNSELGKVPWAQAEEEIIKKANAARARVTALANENERSAMLQSIAVRLPAGPIAEKTLGMMALVMTADGPMNAAEQAALALFTEAFGITSERMKVIVASLRGA